MISVVEDINYTTEVETSDVIVSTSHESLSNSICELDTQKNSTFSASTDFSILCDREIKFLYLS